MKLYLRVQCLGSRQWSSWRDTETIKTRLYSSMGIHMVVLAKSMAINQTTKKLKKFSLFRVGSGGVVFAPARLELRTDRMRFVLRLRMHLARYHFILILRRRNGPTKAFVMCNLNKEVRFLKMIKTSINTSQPLLDIM